MAKKEEKKKNTAVANVEDPAAIVKEKIAGMQASVDAIEIKDEATLQAASDLISKVKKLGAFIKQEKEKLTKPAREIVKQAGLTYDPFLKECENAEIVLKQRAKKYLDDKDAAAKKAEAKVAKDLEAGKISTEKAIEKIDNVEQAPSTVRSTESGIRRSVRKVAVIEKPDLVPDEFWTIDEVRVRREALDREKNGLPQIPGVIIKEESSIASI